MRVSGVGGYAGALVSVYALSDTLVEEEVGTTFAAGNQAAVAVPCLLLADHNVFDGDGLHELIVKVEPSGSVWASDGHSVVAASGRVAVVVDHTEEAVLDVLRGPL